MTRLPYLTTLVYRSTVDGRTCLRTYNHIELAEDKEEAHRQAVLAGEKILPESELMLVSAGTSFVFPKETVLAMAKYYELL